MADPETLDDANLDAAGGAFAEPLEPVNPENMTPSAADASETLSMATFARGRFQRDQGAGFMSWCRATGKATPATRETWEARVAEFGGRPIG